jgi:hypothetical protein
MLDDVRGRLRHRIAEGDSLAAVDEEVDGAAVGLSDEQRAVAWLYGWHRAGGDEACRPSTRQTRAGLRSPRPVFHRAEPPAGE